MARPPSATPNRGSSNRKEQAEGSGSGAGKQRTPAHIDGGVAEMEEAFARCSFRSGFSVAGILGIGSHMYRHVKSTGLGALLTLRYSGTVDRKFYAVLLNKVEPTSMTLRFRDGELRKLSCADVSRVLGLVSGSRTIPIRPPRHRARVVERVQELLGLDVNKSAAITVDDLKKVLQICGVGKLPKKQEEAVKVAYTLLVCATFLAPRQTTATVPEELLSCVLVPSRIGQYNWGQYVLDLIKAEAEKLQGGVADEVKILVLGGCSLFLQMVYLDWVDFGKLGVLHSFVPRIGFYTAEKVKELIKIDGDKRRSFKTKSEMYLKGEKQIWHPLLESATAILDRVEVKGKVTAVVKEDVMSMVRDAVVRYASAASSLPAGHGMEEQTEVVDNLFASLAPDQACIVDKFVNLLLPESEDAVEIASEGVGRDMRRTAGTLQIRENVVQDEPGRVRAPVRAEAVQGRLDDRGKRPMVQEPDTDSSDEDESMLQRDARLARRLQAEEIKQG